MRKKKKYVKYCDIAILNMSGFERDNIYVIINDPMPDPEHKDLCIVTDFNNTLELKPSYLVPKKSLKIIGHTNPNEKFQNLVKEFVPITQNKTNICFTVMRFMSYEDFCGDNKRNDWKYIGSKDYYSYLEALNDFDDNTNGYTKLLQGENGQDLLNKKQELITNFEDPEWVKKNIYVLN